MRVNIKTWFEVGVDGDDEKECEAVRKTIEIQAAGIVERIEALLIERVQPLHPGLKISVGREEDEEAG